MRRRLGPSLTVLAGLALAAAAVAADSATPPAAEVKERWTGRLDGRHFTADVRLLIERGAQREERRVRVWRDDVGGSRERLMARFETPYDLRGVGLLYLENPDRANDYFFYQASTGRVRRIPEAIAREDIYGIDLEFLGFGVAHTEPTELESMQEVSLEGRKALRLEERASRDNPRFDRRTVWLDPETYLPLRTEHSRSDRVVLVGTTSGVEDVQGVPTPIRLRFERPEAGETVTMLVDRIDYEAPIPPAYFSTLALIK